MPRPPRDDARRLRLLPTSVAAVIIALATTVLWATPTHAHTELDEATPRDGARLDSTPRQVVLRFTGPIAPAFARVSATRDGGRPRALDTAVEGSTVTAAMPANSATASGRATWSIAYRVVSDDGHPITGTVTFTAPGRAPSATASGHTPSQPATQSTPSDGRAAATDPASADDEDRGAQVAAGFGLVLLVGAAAVGSFLLSRSRWFTNRRREGPE